MNLVLKRLLWAVVFIVAAYFFKGIWVPLAVFAVIGFFIALSLAAFKMLEANDSPGLRMAGKGVLAAQALTVAILALSVSEFMAGSQWDDYPTQLISRTLTSSDVVGPELCGGEPPHLYEQADGSQLVRCAIGGFVPLGWPFVRRYSLPASLRAAPAASHK